MRHWIDFKQLRAELNFGKLLEHYNVKLKARGKQLVGPCPLPFHEGDRKSDSFSAHVERGVFQCFSCHATGNVFDFAILMEKRNLKNGDDLRKTGIELAKIFRLQSIGEGDKRKPVSPKAQSSAATNESSEASRSRVFINAPLDFTLRDLEYNHLYLRDRGFDSATIDKFDLGYCARGYFKNRIVIPIHNAEGKLIGYAGRLVDDNLITKENPRYLFPGKRVHEEVTHEFRKSLVLYNGHRIGGRVDCLIVVEGFTATWWLTQLGFGHVVSVMGDSISKEQVDQVANLTMPTARVWIVGDGDKAGATFSAKAAEALSTVRFACQIKLPVDSQPTDWPGPYFQAFFGNSKYET